MQNQNYYKKYFSKISFILIILGIFLNSNAIAQAQSQSCNSLKEILENTDFCDKREVSIHGKVLDNSSDYSKQNYASEFSLTDTGNVIQVLSKDYVFLAKDDEVIVNGKYYQNSKDNVSDDRIAVQSSTNITVILTAESYTDLLVNYVGRNIIKNENLQQKILLLYIIAPLLILGAFWGGYILYNRRRIKGITFEGHIENLFDRQEWRIVESNAFRKLGRWVESYSNPDFVFAHKRTNKRIAVECKYKLSLPKEGDRIFWAYEDQIENYQNFSQKQNIPVFVVLGISGRPKNPKRMFLVPLNQINYPSVKMEYLEKFERNPQKHFSLDNQDNLI